MLFTKIWTAVLAVLATACLAGMYLLSTGSSGGFTEADKTAVRAVTEAGIAALASDINSSPVSLGPALLGDTRLAEALAGPAVADPEDPDAPTIDDVLRTVANESLLDIQRHMSAAIVDKGGNILGRTGLAPELFDQLVKQPAFKTALTTDDPVLLSATLGDKLHAVQLSRGQADTQHRRLVTINEIDRGGGSSFRRAVGTQNPAGLIAKGKLIGDGVGQAKAEDLAAFVTQHLANIPPREGASAVFQIGEGPEARIGAAARVPGPAGAGDDGTMLVVLSSHTIGSTQQDMVTALRAALDRGGLGQLNWILVGGLLVISLVLTFYLPFLEFNTPMRRLASEFHAITEARQHEVHHDTYRGEFGRLARSISTAMEALKLSWENELMDSDIEMSDAPRRTRSTRSLRAVRTGRRTGRTRSHEALGGDGSESDADLDEARAPEPEDPTVQLPSAAKPAPAERRTPTPDPGAPALAFNEDPSGALPISDSSDSVSLADAGADREGYYRRIFDEFVETKVACGENTDGFTYEKFAKKLRSQSDSLLGRDDVSDVQFSVYVKDGKAALRAKVIKAT